MMKNIEKTIKSVVDQDYKNIQYIVIDGDSNDNSVSIINNYSKELILLFLSQIKVFTMRLIKVCLMQKVIL